jgi:broad specificity phosphatase PhoE
MMSTAAAKRHIVYLRSSVALVALLGLACVKVRVNRAADVQASAATTTIAVVRHAEKSTDDPRDPSLSAVGRERANALRDVLKDAGISAIYVTNLKRTRQTAQPLADLRGITMSERLAATAAADLARDVLSNASGKSVLIVGHSNTVPQIVQALSGSAIAPIGDDEYDHLFVIVLSPGNAPRLYNLRFGRATP